MFESQLEGTRDIPGFWVENTENAKFWMKDLNDLKERGVADILNAVSDGMQGIGEALRPKAVRKSSKYQVSEPTHTRDPDVLRSLGSRGLRAFRFSPFKCRPALGTLRDRIS